MAVSGNIAMNKTVNASLSSRGANPLYNTIDGVLDGGERHRNIKQPRKAEVRD